ncbi:hypothetical protein AK812_SmicGene48119 [Symbiodinium microadriaticum]|uniref:Uncharacterized protein n=1 Tax=Symbiodinium microadriaticum TaxID=2951 RepID=A0A1Q9BQP3_SYMMI|nr:hypothetical protein AK812_SmicGene48119 [Symbiodinium microadriaticum]
MPIPLACAATCPRPLDACNTGTVDLLPSHLVTTSRGMFKRLHFESYGVRWSDGATPLVSRELREAADDVLLVLSPEHLCSQVAGKSVEEEERRVTDFIPVMRRPVLRFPPPSAKVFAVGECPRGWLATWGLSSCSVHQLALADLVEAWDHGIRCIGVSVDFPPPPDSAGTMLDFVPQPLRRLRSRCLWIRQLLRVFSCLYRTATLGRPARLTIPVRPSFFEPLTTWAQQSASASTDSADVCSTSPACFTLEFILQ